MGVIRVVGLAVAVGTVAVATVFGGNILLLVNVPALMMVIGVTFGLLLWTFGARAFVLFGGLGQMLVGGNPEFDPAAARVARFGARYALMSGCVGVLLGFMQMLATLDDPSKIGGGIALSLLTLLYGIVLAEFLLIPMAAALQSDAPPPTDEETLAGPRTIAGITVAACLLEACALYMAAS